MNLWCRLGFHNQDDATNTFIGVGDMTEVIGEERKVRWFRLICRCSKCGKVMSDYKYYDATPKEGLLETAVGYDLLRDAE